MLLIVVLACLAIVSALGLSALTSAIRMHRETNHTFQLRQTELLIDSAIRRAEVRHDQGVAEIDETWMPVFSDDAFTANVTIRTKDETLFVTAAIKSADGFQTQRSDQIIFPRESR